MKEPEVRLVEGADVADPLMRGQYGDRALVAEDGDRHPVVAPAGAMLCDRVESTDHLAPHTGHRTQQLPRLVVELSLADVEALAVGVVEHRDDRREGRVVGDHDQLEALRPDDPA